MQAFLLQKYLHFYDSVNDGEIDDAKNIFNDPFGRNSTSPTANDAGQIDLKKKDLKIKLSNR